MQKLSKVMGYEISKDSIQIVETKGTFRAGLAGFLALIAFVCAGISGYAIYNNEHSRLVGLFNNTPTITWSIVLLIALAVYAVHRGHYIQIVFKSGDKRKSSAASEKTIRALRTQVNRTLDPDYERSSDTVFELGTSIPKDDIFQISLTLTLVGVVSWTLIALLGLGVLAAVFFFFSSLFNGEWREVGYAALAFVGYLIFGVGANWAAEKFGTKPVISFVGEGGTIHHETGAMGEAYKLKEMLRPAADDVFGENYHISSPMS